MLDAAARELEEEAGLQGSISLKSVYHERIYAQSGEFLEDKYFFICTANITKGELRVEFEGGKNEWVSQGEVLNGNIFYDIADLLALTQENAPAFSEKSYTVEKY